jgi:hypothetical protein
MGVKGFLNWCWKFLTVEFIPGAIVLSIFALEKRVAWLENQKGIDDALNGMEWI